MSDNTYFHLLGPGSQPDDPDFAMNPLPITVGVASEPPMATLEQYHNVTEALQLIEYLLGKCTDYQGDPVHYPVADVTALDDNNRHFLDVLLGEGKSPSSCRWMKRPKSRFRSPSFVDFGACGNPAWSESGRSH